MEEIMEAKKLTIGDKASLTRSVTEYDVYAFAGSTGDFGPGHTNIAHNARLNRSRIAHGVHLSGFVLAVLEMYLPGPGSEPDEQGLKFLKPVEINDTITTTVEITDLIEEPENGRIFVKLSTVCVNQKDEIVASGEATQYAYTRDRAYTFCI